jgi:sigma-B regulation protein RsbU (phosphoserine phosphatase)
MSTILIVLERCPRSLPALLQFSALFVQKVTRIMKIQPRSLQQRTLFFILLPTFFLLVALSVGGYVLVGHILLNQWGEIAVVKLQRTAHLIDMVLRTPKDMLLLLQDSDDTVNNRQVFNQILRKIEKLDSVVGVNVDWPKRDPVTSDSLGEEMKPAMQMMHRYKLDRFDISSPRYDSQLNNRTVSLVSEFKDDNERTIGRVEVVIAFDKLIGQVKSAPWWKNNKAYLVDDSGNVLASTGLELDLEDYFPMRAFGTVNVLEKDTLTAMQQNDSGTVFGPGVPPEEISGFYHIYEAPWTMVIIAPGEKALEPIIEFKFFYILSFTSCIVLILLFIRSATNRVTRRIKAISAEADNLAKGIFGPPLAVTSRDEVGELTRSFNEMTRQLRQRLAMKKAINVAREVQQNLLPDDNFSAEGVAASGLSLYCDETGGDYFDILKFPENRRKVGVVVGDVVGHGIGAALLMTTVRALFRCRIVLPGTLGEVMNDVNKLLSRDTRISGNFATLFYIEVDRMRNTINWVRCGHDPAIVYSPGTRKFSELKGEGVALGVDASWSFEYNELPLPEEKQLIFVGSDGAWDVENANGEQFGKDRIKQLLIAAGDEHPDVILQTIIDEIGAFRGEQPQNDDITLTLIKTC